MSDIKTVTLDGSEYKVEGLNGQNTEIINKSSGAVYASKSPGVVPEEDGVIEIAANTRDGLHGTNGTLYLLGTGKVELRGTDYSVNFRQPSSSTDGGGGDHTVKFTSIPVIGTITGQSDVAALMTEFMTRCIPTEWLKETDNPHLDTTWGDVVVFLKGQLGIGFKRYSGDNVEEIRIWNGWANNNHYYVWSETSKSSNLQWSDVKFLTSYHNDHFVTGNLSASQEGHKSGHGFIFCQGNGRFCLIDNQTEFSVDSAATTTIPSPATSAETVFENYHSKALSKTFDDIWVCTAAPDVSKLYAATLEVNGKKIKMITGNIGVTIG